MKPKTSRSFARQILAVLVSSHVAAWPGAGQVVTDGTAGPGAPVVALGDGDPVAPGNQYLITEDLGRSYGATLLHSLAQLDLVDPADSATFSSISSYESIVARITGGTRSILNGALRSTVEGADLYLLNPAGILFGPDATLDLRGGLFASTADRVQIGDTSFPAAALPPSSVAPGNVLGFDVVSFGFLDGDVAPIEVQGALLEVRAPSEESPIPNNLSLIGGPLSLRPGTALRAPGGRIDLAAVGGPGEVIWRALAPESTFDFVSQETLPGSDPLEVRTSALADIVMEGATIDVPSGLDSFNGQLFSRSSRFAARESLIIAISGTSDDRMPTRSIIDITAERAEIVDTKVDAPPDDYFAGAIRMSLETGDIAGSWFSTSHPINDSSSGPVLISARRDLTITDTLFEAIAIDDDAGLIALSAGGHLSLSGVDLLSFAFQNGGFVELRGGSVGIEDVRVDVSSQLGFTSNNSDFSLVSTDGDIQARNLTVFAASDSNPQILLDSARDLLVEDSFLNADLLGFDFNVSGQPIRPITVGLFGEQVVVRRSSISSSTGFEGGGIVLAGDEIVVEDSTIRADVTDVIGGGASGDGEGGFVLLDGAGSIRIRNSTVSTEAPEELGGEGGDLLISTSGVLEIDRSSITATTNQGQGGGIFIGTTPTEPQLGLEGFVARQPLAVILRNGSTIEARADGEGGRGGAISIASQAVFPLLAPAGPAALESFDFVRGVSGARISAEAGDPQLAGTIQTNTPEVDVERQVTALDVSFLEAQGISGVCAARASGEAGSFQVARYRGLPTSPEDLLLAFDDLGEPETLALGEATGAIDVAAAAAEGQSPALAAGTAALREGKAALAEERFAEALAALGGDGDAGLRSDALRGLGEAQQAQGHFGEAGESLARALELAQAVGDPTREAAALSALGATQVAMRSTGAETVLVRGLSVAQKSGQGGLAARLQTDLGNEAAASQEWTKALARYEAAATQARDAGRPAQEVTALASAARAALEAGEPTRAASLLARAEAVEGLPADGLAAAHRGLHLGRSYAQLAEAAGPGDPDGRRASLQRAFVHLRAAAEGAEALGDARLQSFALGNLAALYESERRPAEALYLTRQALALAEAAEAPDALYRWHWQEGRILWSQGEAQAALASLGRAVEIIEATRQVSLAHYGAASLRFQRAVAPVYRDYVEALLRGADLVGDPQASQRLLREARATMEQYQVAELRDHFRDACVADLEARTVDLDRVLREQSPRTAVVYPIALGERLELLVSLPGGLERHSLAVPAAALDAEVARLRDALARRIGRGYERPAGRLYRWLVAPYRAQLVEADIDTLVFVPGGSLRTIPLGVLYDGERFLLEQFAVAVTPGLSLVDPHRLDTAGERFLLAGLSEGGTFSGQTFDALPKVSEEIAAIRALYGGDVLLDAGFDARGFRRAVVDDQPTVVHVASHAYFGKGPDDSFLLTHDGAVTFDELGAAVGPRRYTEAPLELLVLSACETAAGDQQAALGLAGVAIRSGARSALGSLWAIPDEAAFQVMTGFYRALREPGTSKAQALRRSQLALLHPDGAYHHPYYWAPYLLISNWM